jgi:hypothetical protein
LIFAGDDVVIVDKLSNSSLSAIDDIGIINRFRPVYTRPGLLLTYK